jgi:hypothetical protein
MRFGHLDQAATLDARRNGQFKDRRSRVLRRMDGTQRIVLFGSDKSKLREDCFRRDNYKCVDASSGTKCDGVLQMSHWPPMSKSEGSDQLDQVFCRCFKHHTILDFHGQPAHF